MRLLLLPALLAAAVSANPVARCQVHEANSTSNTSDGSKFMSSAWYAGWHASNGFPVSKISFSKYTHITYAFAGTTSDVNTLAISQEDETVIPQFVSAAHQHGLTASISVGGWAASQYFSTAVATPQNRTAFVKTLSDFVAKYNFDGIDFDWEYPGKQGVGCNTISTHDTANLLLLLQEIRSNPPTSKLILSAATTVVPFVDASGAPSTNVAAFAQVLNFIQIMNYDIFGQWSNAVGPNAPLADACAPAADQQGSAMSAVAAWSKAGFPRKQIVLGVASYGHGYSVPPSAAYQSNTLKLAAYPQFNHSAHPAGDSWDGVAGPDVCGVQQSAGGVFNMWGLVQNGFLTSAGTPAPGIGYRFDDCSKTAYVYDPKTQVEVSFDDAAAFKAKGEYIKSAGLMGFSMWEAGGDYNDILLDAIRSGANQA